MLQPSCLARGHQLQIHQWPEVLHRASQLLGQLAWLLELVLQLGKGGVAPQGMQLFCDDFFHHTLLQVPGVGYSTANPGNEAMFSFHSPACHHHLVLSVRFTQVQEPVVFLDHFPTNSIPQSQCLFRTCFDIAGGNIHEPSALEKLDQPCQFANALPFVFHVISADSAGIVRQYW